MTLCLQPEQIIELNVLVVGESGHVLQRPDRIKGTLGRPMHTFDGVWLYPSIYERAGALLQGLLSSHLFKDGNKRTAWIATLTYLEINGITLAEVEPIEAHNFVISVLTGNIDISDAAIWFADRTAEIVVKSKH